MASTGLLIAKCFFEHIKSGGPCPCHLISELQVSLESRFHINKDNISPLLIQILDYCHGTDTEIVNDRRKLLTIWEYLLNENEEKLLTGGSKGDGLSFYSSDTDLMKILKTVVVTYPDQIHLIPRHSLHKTILSMREADNRPGYVTLKLSKMGYGEGRTAVFQNALVPLRDSLFVSSDIYRQGKVDWMNKKNDGVYASNGPCCTTKFVCGGLDLASAFSCVCWPREANEWINRTRIHGWPTQTMIDRIVQDGCHLVPVGDKCSTDTLLQWRISFACAERLLVHSLTHSQFSVYGLLKHFIAQIKDSLGHLIGDSDILCSYFLKTIIFYAVENSPALFWHEQNTLICFRLCLSILITWVKLGSCPNYFIRNNNMFMRKVHGEKRQRLLHFLIGLYNLKRLCLCVKDKDAYIGELLQQHQILESRPLPECMRDIMLFESCLSFALFPEKYLYASMKSLHVARTDVDEFVAYYAMVTTMFNKAGALLKKDNTARINKQKYIVLKKCKQLLTPFASMCTSPGLMILATIHYLTGNYRKTLQMCADMMSTYRLSIGDARPVRLPPQYYEPYQRLYCGKGYTYLEKMNGVRSSLNFCEENIMLCPSHLHIEITKAPLSVSIPPLPYAAFMSFLCYHELGDMRRRDTELINIRMANYHPKQGGHRYWIVHTLLGICYQTVGDNRSAIMSYTDSLRVKPEWNPAKERIEALRRSQ